MQQIKKDEFEDRISKTGKGVPQDVLKVMCFSDKKYFTIIELKQKLPQYSVDSISGNMSLLLEEQMVARVQNKSATTEFYIREPLFAVYLRLLFRSITNS